METKEIKTEKMIFNESKKTNQEVKNNGWIYKAKADELLIYDALFGWVVVNRFKI